MSDLREVRIRDSLSGDPVALDRGREVGIYACGPTVYSRIHIGNARPYVIFSLLTRYLRDEGYATRLVINVTDVNDKIYTAAVGSGDESATYARRMTGAYIADTDRLGLGRPDSEPLATESVVAIIEMIQSLIDYGHAYESGGDVYYRVSSFKQYGKLSNRTPEDMDQGEESGSAELKESPLDFALWKAHKPGEDTSWESPWGPGRPGWHIECSAMATHELGPTFQIHGGGSDLIFPHHENEIAQSEAASGKPLAHIWMHNGMVETESLKMSKSEGNIFQLSEALDRYGAEAVVAYLTSGHYRQPLSFGPDELEAAQARVARFRNHFLEHGQGASPPDDRPGCESLPEAEQSFRDALADDFNTPRAWAIASEYLVEANRARGGKATESLARMLRLLGLDSVAEPPEPEADKIARELLAEREAARTSKDFERADSLRDEIESRGWQVRDSAEGARLVPRSDR